MGPGVNIVGKPSFTVRYCADTSLYLLKREPMPRWVRQFLTWKALVCFFHAGTEVHAGTSCREVEGVLAGGMADAGAAPKRGTMGQTHQRQGIPCTSFHGPAPICWETLARMPNCQSPWPGASCDQSILGDYLALGPGSFPQLQGSKLLIGTSPCCPLLSSTRQLSFVSGTFELELLATNRRDCRHPLLSASRSLRQRSDCLALQFAGLIRRTPPKG